MKGETKARKAAVHSVGNCRSHTENEDEGTFVSRNTPNLTKTGYIHIPNRWIHKRVPVVWLPIYAITRQTDTKSTLRSPKALVPNLYPLSYHIAAYFHKLHITQITHYTNYTLHKLQINITLHIAKICIMNIVTVISNLCRSQCPRGLRRRITAARLLGSWVRICCVYCVLSGRGLCDELVTRPEESYRMWRFVVCDQETF
jgi:hypothetical protein